MKLNENYTKKGKSRVRKKSVLIPSFFYFPGWVLSGRSPAAALLLMQIRTFQVEDVDDALALSASSFFLLCLLLDI